MDVSTLGSMVGRYAPIIGSVIASGNPMAGILISALSNVFGAKPNDLKDIADKITLDQNSPIKLRQLELDHEEKIRQQNFDDMKNAREREVSIVKETGRRDYVMDSIAIVVIAGYFVCCAMLPFISLSKTDHDILYMMVGQLTGGFIMVLSHYFGSKVK